MSALNFYPEKRLRMVFMSEMKIGCLQGAEMLEPWTSVKIKETLKRFTFP